MAFRIKATAELEEARPMSTQDLQHELIRVVKRHDFAAQPLCAHHVAANIFLEGVVSWCVRWINSHDGYTASYVPWLGILGGPPNVWQIEVRKVDKK